MKTQYQQAVRQVFLSLFLMLYATVPVQADIATQPLFLTSSVAPIVMLTMGRDHKLYYEAYNDASDLNADGFIDVGYKPDIDYYGYFDSHKCYSYASNLFTPTSATLTKKCVGAWSGDFLNYVTTSRIDALRKVLYGGFRSEDTTTNTVLKRAFIPQDAHSWGKEYDPANNPGYLVSDYTPLSEPVLGSRHLFANVSLNYGGQPLMRVLNDSHYRIWEWVSIERPVAGARCLHGGNGPDCATAAGSSWQLVPSAVLSGLVRTTYDISGTGSGHPNSHGDFDNWEANYAVPALAFGSGSMSEFNGNDNNPYGSNDNYMTIVTGTINVPVTGSYHFSVDGDDAVEVIINGSVVAGWYGGHGKCNCNSHDGSYFLTGGTDYSIKFRHEERGGGDSFFLRWEESVPASAMTDYSVNVKVCVAGLLETNCKAYTDGNTTTYKPTGLLHTYGENDAMAFGLLTGSYKKNTSGGVLRKNISSFTDELDPDTGIFTNTNGIVSTIDKLRVTTFHYNSHSYASGWIVNRPIHEGEAAEWGNPVAEMMYEGLRYFAGKASPTSDYSIGAGDNPDAGLGLALPNWLDPYESVDNGGGGYLNCAKPMQLVISDINPSYDTDQLPGSYFDSFSGDLAGLNVATLADTIWAGETEASNIFIGQSAGLSDGAPTAKPVSSFSNIRGLAPEEPTKLGGFYAASVALYGKQTDLNLVDGDQKSETLAVALASPLPRIEIPVDGQTVTLVPFAKSVGGFGISSSSSAFQPTNQIVDFYVDKIVNVDGGSIDLAVNGGRPYGKFRINYEDVEQAADHDMDAIVEYTFTVNASNQVVVSLNSTYAAGSIIQHMGYVISGTTTDGMYLEVRDKDTGAGSDPDYFLDTPPGELPGGIWADGQALPLSTSRTFTVGNTTSASFIKHDPLWYAAKWGVTDQNNDNILDIEEWDDNTDGIPDGYFLVTNAGTLPEQLGKAFARLLNNVSSASAVAANTSRLDTGTLVYQARFDPRDWSGQLLALSVDSVTGDVNTLTPNWEAASALPAAASRNIYTYNPAAAAGARGIPFEWIELTASQQAQLNQLDGVTDTAGEDRLNWLRGDNAGELRLGGNFRNRIKKFDENFMVSDAELSDSSIDTYKLGDIVNSDPIYVGAEDYGYTELAGAEGSSYSAFMSSKASRRPMLYVGANDGMLHGFDARKNTGGFTAGGTEIFAYIPNSLFPELSKLTSFAYVHQYLVDGISAAGDAYFNSAWHSILAGVTGAGGRSVFALDVTDPDAFGTASALWEFDSSDDVDLGYTLAQPAIGKMKNGSWAVVVANGYSSAAGKAVLFILDAATGAVIRKIDTGVAGGNGLSAPVLADIDGDRMVDAIYAGDLLGNLWKFDVSSSASASWGVANSGSPLFVACETTGVSCASTNLQAITAKPAVGPVGVDQETGIMVYFGTGKYFESTDNVVGSSPQVNTFYGLWDNNAAISDRAELQEQVIEYEGAPVTAGGDVGDGVVRVTSRRSVCYSAATITAGDDTPIPDCSVPGALKKGWAMDLLKPVNIAQGERVVSVPILYQDLVIFSTLIPSPDPCQSGGDSRVMLVDALSGRRPLASSFDLFGTTDSDPDTTVDGIVNTDDLVHVDDGTPDGQMVAASGLSLDIGIHRNISVIGTHGYASGSSGDLGHITLVGGSGSGDGRLFWQQLK